MITTVAAAAVSTGGELSMSRVVEFPEEKMAEAELPVPWKILAAVGWRVVAETVMARGGGAAGWTVTATLRMSAEAGKDVGGAGPLGTGVCATTGTCRCFRPFPYRNAVGNLGAAMVFQRGRRDRARHTDRAADSCERVDPGLRLRQAPITLSGRERQRVAIVRVLAARPSLLLSGASTDDLEAATARGVLAPPGTLHAEGMTGPVITDDSVVAAQGQHGRDSRRPGVGGIPV